LFFYGFLDKTDTNKVNENKDEIIDNKKSYKRWYSVNLSNNDQKEMFFKYLQNIFTENEYDKFNLLLQNKINKLNDEEFITSKSMNEHNTDTDIIIDNSTSIEQFELTLFKKLLIEVADYSKEQLIFYDKKWHFEEISTIFVRFL